MKKVPFSMSSVEGATSGGTKKCRPASLGPIAPFTVKTLSAGSGLCSVSAARAGVAWCEPTVVRVHFRPTTWSHNDADDPSISTHHLVRQHRRPLP
jgi:hypothetical protein